MKTRIYPALLLLALFTLPACGTVNGVRWAYNQPSIYDKPDDAAESYGFRAIVGLPVIVGGFAFDCVTFPFQAAFGVWPWWGDSSTQLVPKRTD